MIAEGIVRVVEEHARGRQVTAVAVQVGALRQVSPPALELAFELGEAREGHDTFTKPFRDRQRWPLVIAREYTLPMVWHREVNLSCHSSRSKMRA